MTGENACVRDNDGRKLDHKTLEVLRMRAVEQVAAGAHPEEVAVTMGLHKNTVYGWLAKVREGGRDALKAKAIAGRPPKLAATHLSRGVPPLFRTADRIRSDLERMREIGWEIHEIQAGVSR